jgi:hypothetical protein
VAAGAACGLAVACEYDAALMAGGVLVAACFSSFRRAGCLVLGAIPMVSLIPIYNWICLGTPFSLSYGHEAVFTQMHTGFYGVYLPNLANFFDLLLRPERGLFLWTPFLLLSFFGYARLRARSRSLFWLCCLVPILHLVLMSGYYTTLAGSTLGARFLAPLLPLLILPAGTGASRAPRFALVSAFWSVAAMGGATLVEARLPNQLDNPLWQFYLPEFLAGHFTHNLGQAIGLRGWWSMAPMLLVVCGGIWHVWRSLGKNDSTIERPQTQGKAAHEKDVGKAKNESF